MGNLIPVRVTNQVGTISDNLVEVEASIRAKVAEYRTVVVTEETILDGKHFLADIRKEKETLEKERKAIKAAWMQPYNDFEARAKKLIALYDEPVQVIDTQLKELEKQRKEQKRQEIQSIYDATKGDRGEWLPLAKIYDTRWENTTYSSKKIREEMERAFHQMEDSIETIRSLQSEFEAEGLDTLKATGSLPTAIEAIRQRERMKQEILAKEEQRKQEESERARAEEERRKQEELRQNQPAEPEQPFSFSEAEKPEIPFEVSEERDAEEWIKPFQGEEAPFVIEPFQGEEAPFATEPEVVVKVYVRESFLEEFEQFLISHYIRFEEETK